MTSKLGFARTILTGGGVGCLSASFLCVLWTWMFQPELFGDGQYAMIFLLTSPLGWLIGSLIGACVAFCHGGITSSRRSFLTGAGLVIGGTVLSPFPGTMLVMAIFSTIGWIMELFKMLAESVERG